MKRIALAAACCLTLSTTLHAAVSVGAPSAIASQPIDLLGIGTTDWTVYGPGTGEAASAGGPSIGALTTVGTSGNQQDFSGIPGAPTNNTGTSPGYLVFRNDTPVATPDTGMGWSIDITSQTPGTDELLTFYGGAFDAVGTLRVLDAPGGAELAPSVAINTGAVDLFQQVEVTFDQDFTLEYSLTTDNGASPFSNVGISAIAIGVPTAVPEPGSLAFAASLLGLGLIRRRRRA